MIPKQLIDFLDKKEFAEFTSLLPKYLSDFTEAEKQELLVYIIDLFEYFDKRLFKQLKQAIEFIVESKVCLNFNIDHYAPTFLSLVIFRLPSKEVFDYFVRKGADINFVGDIFAFEDPIESYHRERYETCLDFAKVRMSDIFILHQSYLPEKKVDDFLGDYSGENIIIDKSEYILLYQRAELLNDLIATDNLIDYIKGSGGKMYDELKGTTKIPPTCSPTE